MSNYDPGEITSKPSQEKPNGRFPVILHLAAFISVIVGAVGSVALTLRAGRSSPLLLLVLFIVWVLLPFVALAWANVVSNRWSVLTRVTLDFVSLIIALASLALYGKIIPAPTGSANAFMFVIVPPASLLLAAITVSIAALISRRHSR